MLQGDDDDDQGHVQAMRSVHKSLPPNVIAPATPEEIFYVDCQTDPETQRQFVLWDDIVQAFDNAVQVRNKARVMPFLKSVDFKILEPRRISAVPNTVLDVVVVGEQVDSDVTPSKSITKESVPMLLQKETENMDKDVAVIPESATCTVRRNPAYGLVEAAMENYTHIDRPPPPARGPQALLNDQTPSTKDPQGHQQPNIENSLLRAPQSTPAVISETLKLAKTITSVNHGDKAAIVALGDKYRDGEGVQQDYKVAMDLYLEAAEQGDAQGQRNVGYLYERGFGVAQDYSSAMDWYMKAARQGHPDAQTSVGYYYDIGQGVALDYSEALKWYLKAAHQGLARAQNNLGVLYDQGQGVPKDPSQAQFWYLKAARQGHADSQCNLGCLYDIGRGVSQDYSRAMELYLQAAKQGHSRAHNNIGSLYEYGQGVSQDYSKAMEWFQKAANLGSERAKKNFERLEKGGYSID
ncbi:hypothetical protein BGZ95_007240 [Linnemannia exigua]|uniref:HCP-like protein n=1 Tax=Linnemannia exigua TaxID=604196 RepID=A0AAD4HBA1_9FUNG|nr:hypothetical protein BGZ95_007240 [Linnemannia exigua]